jgi:hypothetical protein
MGTASIESLDDVPGTSAESQASLRFEALTRCGPLALALRCARADAASAGNPPRLLQAALLLARAEPLLQMLEDWLGEALDPVPVEAHAPASASAACAEGVLSDEQGLVHVRIELPWAAVLQGAPHDDGLRARLDGLLRWEPVPVQLVVSQQMLTPSEWAQLQRPGAALLLPESFTAGAWGCSLRSQRTEMHERAVFWRPDDGGLLWSGGPERRQGAAPPVRHDQVSVEVRLHQALPLTPPQLAGWPGVPQPACRADRAVVVCHDSHGRVETRLHGHLLPLGLLAARVHHDNDAGATHVSAGYALRIEEVLS